MRKVYLILSLALPLLFISTTRAQNSRLLLVQKSDQNLAIFDPGTDLLIGQVPLGGKIGPEVAVSPDGKTAYVPTDGNGSSALAVIDVASQKVIGKVDFGKENQPNKVVFGPKDGLLYVTTELDQAVTIVDPKTLKIVGTISTGQPESHMLAISHDGRFGYTANVGSGTISVLDLEGRKALKTIQVAGKIQGVSVSADDKWVFTSDQNKAQLAVVDVSSGAVKKWVSLEGVGSGAASTPDGRFLLVAIPSKHDVAVIDLKTLKVANTVGVASDPVEVVMSADGRTAWVSCESANEVVAFDTTEWRLSDAIQSGKQPLGMAWAEPR